jgi:hypothetical protein
VSKTGRVNLTILSATDISLYNSTIDFGQGVVNSSNAACNDVAVISSNGSTGYNKDFCWANDTYAVGRPNSPVGNESKKLLIQNDGNINVTITMTSAQQNYSNFIGNCSSGHNWYRYSVVINASETAYTCPGTNIASDWRNFSSGTLYVCNESAWEDASDTIGLVFNISICASNSPTGLRDDNLTITSAAAP